MTKVKVGCVHGRFQPAHKEHWEYILAAHRKCDYLFVGITQYEIEQLVDCTKDPHRSDQKNNPLTYRERAELIEVMFEAKGIPRSTYEFTPFPIDEPAKLKEFIAPEVVCYTTLVDHWNEEKIKRLQCAGYIVEVLWNRMGQQNVLRSSKIRELAEAGDRGWHELVEPAALAYLKTMGFEKRVSSARDLM